MPTPSQPVPFENFYHAVYVPVIADLNAPTVAEIEAGVDLTKSLTANGVNVNSTQNMATLQMLTGFIRSQVGSFGEQFTLTFVDQEGSDVRALFDTHGKVGHLVISPYGAPVEGKPVRVYPVSSSLPQDVATASDTFQTFVVSMGVPSEPSKNAVVAAGTGG